MTRAVSLNLEINEANELKTSSSMTGRGRVICPAMWLLLLRNQELNEQLSLACHVISARKL